MAQLTPDQRGSTNETTKDIPAWKDAKPIAEELIYQGFEPLYIIPHPIDPYTHIIWKPGKNCDYKNETHVLALRWKAIKDLNRLLIKNDLKPPVLPFQ